MFWLGENNKMDLKTLKAEESLKLTKEEFEKLVWDRKLFKFNYGLFAVEVLTEMCHVAVFAPETCGMYGKLYLVHIDIQ